MHTESGRGAAANSRRNRLTPWSAGRPQRRRLDRRNPCRSFSGHRIRGLVLMRPHSSPEEMGIAEIARGRDAMRRPDLQGPLRALSRRCRQRLPWLERRMARSRIPQMGHHPGTRLYPRPILIVQGEDDQSASRQVEAAQEECFARRVICPAAAMRRTGARRRLQAGSTSAALLRDHHEGLRAAPAGLPRHEL